MLYMIFDTFSRILVVLVFTINLFKVIYIYEML